VSLSREFHGIRPRFVLILQVVPNLFDRLKRQQIRFIFKYGSELYKFLSIFTSHDNSFYFHLYEESDQPFRYYKSSMTEENQLKIDIKHPVATEFIRHKFSFHQSGYVHYTNKKGGRYKDGVKGIPFNDIESSNLILLLAPKNIPQLEKYKAKKDGHNFIIPLSMDQSPFSLNFEVFRKSKIQNLPTIPIDIHQGLYTYCWNDLEFGLRFYIQNIIGPLEWPESSLVLKRVE